MIICTLAVCKTYTTHSYAYGQGSLPGPRKGLEAEASLLRGKSSPTLARGLIQPYK